MIGLTTESVFRSVSLGRMVRGRLSADGRDSARAHSGWGLTLESRRLASNGEIFFDVDAFDVIADVHASDLSTNGKHVSLSALRKAAGF